MYKHVEGKNLNVIRMRRTGAYSNSQRTQNKGYKIHVAAVHTKKVNGGS